MSKGNGVRPMVFSVQSLEQVETNIQEALRQGITPTLAIVFCSVVYPLEEIRRLFARHNIDLFGASSSGEIANCEAHEESIAVMLLNIDRKVYKLSVFDAQEMTSYRVGQDLADWATTAYEKPALMVTSAGLHADGEQIVHGIIDKVGYQVPLFGGLAGDDLRMHETFVFSTSQVISNGVVALVFDRNAIELYGTAVSGWRGIGTPKTITKAEGNVVYMIDNQPALDVYREYLGVTGNRSDHTLAAEYPLLLERDDGSSVLRAAMLVNGDKSMVYAGTMPEGARVQFSMPPGFEIVEYAIEQLSVFNKQISEADAMVLFSCKARHLVLGPMVEDELSGICKLWNVPLVGFFTYGEIGPNSGGRCDFHNDTLSLVLIQGR